MESHLAYRLTALEALTLGDTSPFPPGAYQFAINRLTVAQKLTLDLMSDTEIQDQIFGDDENDLSCAITDGIRFWADEK